MTNTANKSELSDKATDLNLPDEATNKETFWKIMAALGDAEDGYNVGAGLIRYGIILSAEKAKEVRNWQVSDSGQSAIHLSSLGFLGFSVFSTWLTHKAKQIEEEEEEEEKVKKWTWYAEKTASAWTIVRETIKGFKNPWKGFGNLILMNHLLDRYVNKYQDLKYDAPMEALRYPMGIAIGALVVLLRWTNRYNNDLRDNLIKDCGKLVTTINESDSFGCNLVALKGDPTNKEVLLSFLETGPEKTGLEREQDCRKDALILFNNDLYYMDRKKLEAKKIVQSNEQEQKDIDSLKLKCEEKYKEADENQAAIINRLKKKNITENIKSFRAKIKEIRKKLPNGAVGILRVGLTNVWESFYNYGGEATLTFDKFGVCMAPPPVMLTIIAFQLLFMSINILAKVAAEIVTQHNAKVAIYKCKLRLLAKECVFNVQADYEEWQSLQGDDPATKTKRVILAEKIKETVNNFQSKKEKYQKKSKLSLLLAGLCGLQDGITIYAGINAGLFATSTLLGLGGLYIPPLAIVICMVCGLLAIVPVMIAAGQKFKEAAKAQKEQNDNFSTFCNEVLKEENSEFKLKNLCQKESTKDKTLLEDIQNTTCEFSQNTNFQKVAEVARAFYAGVDKGPNEAKFTFLKYQTETKDGNYENPGWLSAMIGIFTIFCASVRAGRAVYRASFLWESEEPTSTPTVPAPSMPAVEKVTPPPPSPPDPGTTLQLPTQQQEKPSFFPREVNKSPRPRLPTPATKSRPLPRPCAVEAMCINEPSGYGQESLIPMS
jgi:hypothetical protein